VASFVPKELTIALHLPIFPASVIGFAIKPDISSVAIKAVVFELTLVILDEFVLSEMLE